MGLQDRDYYPELSDDESWRGPKAKKPIAITTILICLCVAVSIADLVTSSSASPESNSRAASVDSRPHHPLIEALGLSTQPRDLIWAPYRLLTYGFAHSPLNGLGNSTVHLIFNMIGLYFFGNFCEQLLGRAEYLRFYLVSVIFAGAAFLLVGYATGQLAFVVGASGALMACVALAGWKRPHDRVLLYGVADLPLWGLAVGYVTMDLFGVFFGAFGLLHSNTAFTCHLGGALFATIYHNLGMGFGFVDFKRWGTWRRQAATRRNLKVHADDEAPEKASELASLAAQADQLLAKIQDKGQSSLTQRERDILERYSREVQNKRSHRT
jgi:membrane associated rhomboid family serine protease